MYKLQFRDVAPSGKRIWKEFRYNSPRFDSVRGAYLFACGLDQDGMYDPASVRIVDDQGVVQDIPKTAAEWKE